MRTTVTLDDDVVAEIDKLRRSEGVGVSEAVNRLLRRGLARPHSTAPYQHRSVDIGLKGDVSNIAEVLDLLDER